MQDGWGLELVPNLVQHYRCPFRVSCTLDRVAWAAIDSAPLTVACLALPTASSSFPQPNPEGSRVTVRGLAPAPGGGLVASLAVTLDDVPDAEAALEEAQYLAAVLRLEPGQVLSPDTFGRVVAVGAPPAASGRSPTRHSVAAVTAGPCEVAEAGLGVGAGDGAVGRRGDGSPGEVAATYAPAHLSEDKWDLPGTPMPGHSAASAAASPGPAISPDAFASLPTMVTKAPRPTEGRLRWSEEDEAGAAGVHTPEASPALPTAEPARRARRISVHVPDTSVEAWEAPRVERTGGLFRRREVAVPSRQEEMLASLRSRLPGRRWAGGRCICV